jgi:hypothetical protein
MKQMVINKKLLDYFICFYLLIILYLHNIFLKNNFGLILKYFKLDIKN